jgi:hypothetical protein
MEATTTKLIGYSVKNGVATIELTNAPMNCYTFDMMSQIDEAVLKALRYLSLIPITLIIYRLLLISRKTLIYPRLFGYLCFTAISCR